MRNDVLSNDVFLRTYSRHSVAHDVGIGKLAESLGFVALDKSLPLCWPALFSVK